MRILLTGANGKLGSYLASLLTTSHDLLGCSSKDLDITDFRAVQKIVRDYQPDLIINSAAWTQVDACAVDPEKAIAINGYGAQHLAIAAYEVGAAILQVSSNEVFDGKATQPYYEYDQRQAVNPYGHSKLVGESAVMTTNPRHYIVRTSWLYAHGGRNFIHAILGAAQAEKPLRVVIDEVAHPTYTNDLADALAKLIETGRYGVYHFVNAGAVSRYDFARYALDRAGYAHVPITPISHHEWQRPSTPPTYTPLANLAGQQIGITLRDWREAVDAFLEKESLLVRE